MNGTRGTTQASESGEQRDSIDRSCWEPIQNGQHVLVGELPGPAPGDWVVIEVDCDASGSGQSPLARATDELQRVAAHFVPQSVSTAHGLPADFAGFNPEIDRNSPIAQDLETIGPPGFPLLRDNRMEDKGRMGGKRRSGTERPASSAGGVAQRLLGETDSKSLETRLVDAANQLAALAQQPCALLVLNIHLADQPSLASLRKILHHPGWLALPLVLHCRDRECIDQLKSSIEACGGIVMHTPVPRANESPEAHTAENQARNWDWRSASSKSKRLLRAAAAIGHSFEAELLAKLVRQPTTRVLEQLQQAVDEGAPLSDSASGVLSMPDSLVGELRANTLPTLLQRWNKELASFIGGESNNVDPDESSTFSDPDVAIRDTAATADPLPPSTTSASAVEQRSDPSSSARVADLQGADKQRAAKHLQDAGNIEAASEALLEACREQLEAGDHFSAHKTLREASELTSQLRHPVERAMAGIRIQIATARLQWMSAGLVPVPTQSGERSDVGSSQGYTLAEALDSAEAARQALPAEAPPNIIVELANLYAAIAYDLGDSEALQRSLELLVAASRLLVARGDSFSAALMLNDQAAVNLRLGDPVQTIHLLKRSADVFKHVSQQPDASRSRQREALLALAQTEHLLARLPLHARARPGRDADALSMALDNAQQAESRFQQLQRPLECARVWETMARLELLRQNPSAAAAKLSRAVKVQHRLADATGLARSCAAYAEVLMDSNQYEQALNMLAESVALNFRKGSRVGLAFNREAIGKMTAAKPELPQELHDGLQALQGELDRAQQILGRADLPWSE